MTGRVFRISGEGRLYEVRAPGGHAERWITVAENVEANRGRLLAAVERVYRLGVKDGKAAIRRAIMED